MYNKWTNQWIEPAYRMDKIDWDNVVPNTHTHTQHIFIHFIYPFPFHFSSDPKILFIFVQLDSIFIHWNQSCAWPDIKYTHAHTVVGRSILIDYIQSSWPFFYQWPIVSKTHLQTTKNMKELIKLNLITTDNINRKKTPFVHHHHHNTYSFD